MTFSLVKSVISRHFNSGNGRRRHLAPQLLRKVPTARLTDVPGPQSWNGTILEVVKHPVLAK